MLILTLAAGASVAEELWIAADPPVAEPDGQIRVRLMQGKDFSGEEQAYDPFLSRRFQRVWNDGRSNLGAGNGTLPAATFRASAPGVELLAYESRPTRRGAGSDQVTHFCKALVVVDGAAEGASLPWSELGQRLEIVPQTDPVGLLRRGGTLEVQVLLEREPLAGAAVVAMPAGDPGTSRRAVTDEIGLARLELDRQGTWLIKVLRKESQDEVLVSTLVLEAGSPVELSRARGARRRD
jgi:hypothetical protein